MKTPLAALACVVCVGGCGSTDDRVEIIETDRPQKLIADLQDVWQRLQAAEDEQAALGAPLPAAYRADLERLARLADHTHSEGDPDPHVRATCLSMLARSMYWRDRDVFVRALADPARRCRWEALHALRRKKDPGAIPEVIATLARTPPLELEVRLEAIRLLSDLHAVEAIGALVAIATDLLERDRGAMAAAQALRRLTGQSFSSEDYLAWKTWYEGHRAASGASPQASAPGVESSPAEGNGAGGGASPANR